MLTRRSKNVFLSLLAAASLVAGPGLAGPPGNEDVGENEAKDTRTFDITLDGEPGAGAATATRRPGRDRSVPGLRHHAERHGRDERLQPRKGPARQAAAHHDDHVRRGHHGLRHARGRQFRRLRAQATIPVTKDQYVYTFNWSNGATQHAETWTEQSHVNQCAPGTWTESR